MNNSSDTDSKRVVLGQLGKVHGIKGWLKLNSFTTPPQNILDYARLQAGIDKGWEELEIDQFRQQANDLLVHIKGIDDPESARRLTGVELAVSSDQMPEAEAGSYYWHELEGMTVTNQQGEIFGVVARLMETGANDVLVVQPGSDSIDERERLIPFLTDSVVRQVDTVNRKIVVDWEADYLE